MRRSVAFLLLAAALVSVAPAASALQPIRRSFGELTMPRVRAGAVQVPSGHARGRVQVIVELPQAPLAVYGRSLQSSGAVRRLNVSSSSSRAYLASLDAAQRAATVALRRAIPEARVSRRFRIVLDGLAVDLPARRLPALARLPFATHVYPSLRFTLALNRSPSIIGETALEVATGARGDGVKIGVVDDGVDQTNPFFAPEGFQYPTGFPKGNKDYVTPKVIVARAFAGPNSGNPGRLPVDRKASFHGTHVAGIAAGDAGTNAPAGRDHPAVEGLSGVAPRAWIGNYRVFTVPTPIGHVANTPEIIAAFEAAVADGMDVINFSGGGPETEPANDAMLQTVRNVAAAGVVPVIAAGNDRDDFGLGSAGSPGTAPDAISVAAVSNTHVFSPTLSVTAPGAPDVVKQIPFALGAGGAPPQSWGTADQRLVDVGSIAGGTPLSPVDRQLCGSSADPNDPGSTQLPPHSLDGAIALASRGRCTFVSKSLRARAAGAIGLVLVDNRPGEANGIPIDLAVPAGMISDLDGARLRAYLGGGGSAPVRITRDFQRVETGRSGIVTSFSSAGPTDFGHALKPDVSAPGGQVLSSTLPEFAGSPFAVFDGTSMATPHVAGAAALLVELHRAWRPQQVKSALVSSAGPAWQDTGRTAEAPVTLQGGGLVDLPAAADPKLFTNPVSISYGDLNVNRGATSAARLVRVSDAGGGAGDWQVELRPQSATAGATLDLPTTIAIAPGGEAELPVVARASAEAKVGSNFGFIVLRNGATTRRIPYLFLVTQPQLESVQAVPLKKLQLGNTISGSSRVDHYCCPAAPFGPPPDYTGPPMNESGAEKLFVIRLNDAAVNLGVSVLESTQGSSIDPFLLGSKDENDVQGYAGTPVNVNALTFDYRVDIGAAATVFPRQGSYYVSVDSGSDLFSGRDLAGRYLLNAWVNDVAPPRVTLLTTRVSAGRPTLVARVLDGGAGVDPLSLALSYKRILVGAAAYDQASGIALFPLPKDAPALTRRTPGVVVASDFQEAKNVNTSGQDIQPNTGFKAVRIAVVQGPTLTWLAPDSGRCVGRQARLVVNAGSTKPLKAVRFLDGKRPIATVRRGLSGLFATDWKTARLRAGKHTLSAVLVDSAGRRAAAKRVVRVCR